MRPLSRMLLVPTFKSSRSTRRRQLPHRPRFESLEDRTVPATLTVNPADPTAFHTIGAAITASHSGDTIQVAQATYNEDVLINKSLSLVGVPNATTKAKPIITGTGGAKGAENVVAIAPNISGVLIQNFLITSPNSINPTQVGIAIGGGDNNVTITSDIIRSIRNASHPIAGASQTVGIQIGAKAHNVQITHNTISDITYGTTGVDVTHQLAEGIVLASGTSSDGPNHVLIQHDLISKIGDVGINITNSSNAVVVDHVTIALISGLNVGGLGIAIGGSTGSPTNITITGIVVKEVSGKQATGISVAGTATGIQLLDDSLTMVTTGAGLGVSGSASVSVTGSTFTANAIGIVVHTGFTGSLTLHFNIISGNTGSGISNLTTHSVDAEANWWGSATGPKNSGNPSGTGDKVIGTVDFSNWLTLPAGSGAAVRLPIHALSTNAVRQFFTMTDTDSVW
jgi:hypothetical protein